MARAPRVAPSETEFMSMRRIVVEYLCSRLSDHQLATFITLQFGKLSAASSSCPNMGTLNMSNAACPTSWKVTQKNRFSFGVAISA